MRRIGAIAVGFGVLCAATTAAQRSPVRLTEAERAIRVEKGAVLVAALKRESPIEPERLAEAIRVALVDTDAAIRELAVATISGRNLATTLLHGDAKVKSEWERERPELQRLRPMVVKALDDENESVRLSLARLYRREPSPGVRSFIVAALGASAKQNPAALTTLRVAARDEAPTVRDMALRAMSELEP